MFKLPDGIPTLRSSSQEWADYAEYLALMDGKVSLHQIIKIPQLVSDEIIVSGINDTSDDFNDKTNGISFEIYRRKNLLKDRYPFNTIENGYSILHESDDNNYNWIYLFLLLCTRLNMTKHKVQGGLDGTQVFEKLSSIVAKHFFGDKAEVDILGTSKADVGGFRAKLLDLTKKMREGGDIHQNKGFRPQDDNVDVVLWKGFSDQQPSQIIAFGQCKTGTSWADKLSVLNTEAFCKTWFTRQPVITPLRMFFCAQYFPNEIWLPRANEAGLVFDRFRILEYLPANIEVEMMDNIKTWCNAILAN